LPFKWTEGILEEPLPILYTLNPLSEILKSSISLGEESSNYSQVLQELEVYIKVKNTYFLTIL